MFKYFIIILNIFHLVIFNALSDINIIENGKILESFKQFNKMYFVK